MQSNRDSPPSIVLPTLLACSSVICEDLLVEIFKRLPAKTLCRFLSVCMSWYNLISSTRFIELHNSFACSATPPNLKPYLRVRRSNAYVLCRPQQLSSNDHLKRQLHFPLRTQRDARRENFTFVDVIHGVVCISYDFESRFDSTILWNPAIHRFAALPWIPFPMDLEKANFDMEVEFGCNVHQLVDKVEIDCSAIGFGYDISDNDFKVVRIWIPTAPYRKSLLPTYKVYSYERGILRVATADILKSCHFLKEIRTSKTGCFVNGSIHWIIHAGKNSRFARSVLMFDCEGEVFRIVDFPVETSYKQKTELMEYAGMLSVVVHSCVDGDNPTYVELWVMEEHGVATSWKKLYRFKLSMARYDLYDIYEDSYVNLAPYGPKQWSAFSHRYDEISSVHVYEESIFLVDDAKSKSYTEEEIVCISY